MRKTISLLILILIAGCAPASDATGEPTPGQINPASEEPSAQLQTNLIDYDIVELVVRDLSIRLDYELNNIAVVSIESVEWPNGGLGCPVPGADYDQVITPGYRIVLEAGREFYTYHTNTTQALVLCRDGFPEFPLLLVGPDDIQDGIPWMPVDPVPTVDEGDTIADPDPVR